MDDELERFKTEINLTAYMADEYGYTIDRKESSRNSAVMRHHNSDKLIVARDHDGHWIYFSVRDDRDNGSIIDFIQHQQPCSLGYVRQALRIWTGSARPKAEPETYAPKLERTNRDRLAVMAEFSRMKQAGNHPYLEQERFIPPDILKSPRFAGKIHIDSRNNAIFAYYDLTGLCGLEMKNRNFTGFSKGGTKGLWFSVAMKGDTRLVFAESAIDALSYHALHPNEHARYASTGGEMNPAQPELIRKAIEKMPVDAEIIIATDADPAGRELAGRIRQIAQEAGRHNVICHEPAEEGSDWNDQLRARAGKGVHHDVKLRNM